MSTRTCSGSTDPIVISGSDSTPACAYSPSRTLTLRIAPSIGALTTVLSRSDPRLVECRIRLAELCPGFLALGRQDLNLLLRAGESGLCSGNARVGFLGIGGSSFKALARRPSIAGELDVARVIERGAGRARLWRCRAQRGPDQSHRTARSNSGRWRGIDAFAAATAASPWATAAR